MARIENKGNLVLKSGHFYYQTIISQSFINNSYYYTLIGLIKGERKWYLGNIVLFLNALDTRRSKPVSSAFRQKSQSSLEICFYFYLIRRPEEGREGECPRAREVRDHLRIIAKLGNIEPVYGVENILKIVSTHLAGISYLYIFNYFPRLQNKYQNELSSKL